mmetsp:Transcript_3503/g.11443  ORF Transcript_3503/g.11443 Transcript_3503/m.11443 type:complete len:501 (-) Transcript_3503:567-2069(-)
MLSTAEKQEKFWQKEANATLLLRNNKYLAHGTPTPADIRPLSSLVLSRHSQHPDAPPSSFTLSPDIEQIIVRDSLRTFASAEYRETFGQILRRVAHGVGSYGQGMSYVASFWSLGEEGPDAEAALVLLGSRDFKGYWAPEAVGFATDSYVVAELGSRRPATAPVLRHLDKLGLLPNTYMQKWLVGWGVHVLTFQALVDIFPAIAEYGAPALFHLAFAILEALSDRLLKVTSPQDAYALLRMDEKAVPDFAELSVRIAKATTKAVAADPTLGGADLDAMRTDLYDRKLRAGMEAAAAMQAEAAAAAAAGSDDESDEELECQECREDLPDVYCSTCNLGFCNKCNKRGAHSKQGHDTVEFDFDDKTHIKSSIALESDEDDSDEEDSDDGADSDDGDADGEDDDEDDERAAAAQRAARPAAVASAAAVGAGAATQTVWLDKGPTSAPASALADFHELGLCARVQDGKVYVVRSIRFLARGAVPTATHQRVQAACGPNRFREAA